MKTLTKKSIFRATLRVLPLSVALLMGGQAAWAADITTQASSNWSTTSTWTGGSVPTTTDNATIAHDVSIISAATINNLTVNVGKKLFIRNALTVNGTATINGSITLGSGRVLPAAITAIGGQFVNEGNFSMPATVTSIGSLDVTGGVLTLSADNVINGNVRLYENIDGTLKFSAGNKTITGGGKTIAALDISAMAAGDTISMVAGGTLTITNTVANLECPAGTSHVGGTALASGTTCTVVAAAPPPPVVPPPISASVDLNSQKSVIYSKEISVTE
jgi:hypothetical protein